MSGFFEKSNQAAESKQTADHIKSLCFEQFQCQKPLSGFFKKCKQTAESKQTADRLKNSKLSYLTTLYRISVVISQC